MSSTPSIALSPGMPRPSGAPKVIGILNIVFGSALALGGLCCGVYLLTLSSLSPVIGAQQNLMQQQFQASQVAERTAALDQLKQALEAAEADDEKQRIQAEIDALEATPMAVMPAMPDMTKMYGMNNPRVIGFSSVDMLSSILLNVVLIVSGVGLVALREWGRKLAIIVAGLKIARLLVLQTISIIFIVPAMAKQMAEAMEQMMSQMPSGSGGGPPPGFSSNFAMVYGTSMTVTAVCMVIFGSIYPCIVLWVLTRPQAKAACTSN
jgi:hypothetical protein